MMSDTNAQSGSGEKSRLTRSIVIELPTKEALFLTWRAEVLKIVGKLMQKEVYFATIASYSLCKENM